MDHDASVQTAQSSSPTWLTLRGLRRDDALVVFADAIEFFGSLAREFDAIAPDLTWRERRDFSAARRAYLHDLLDMALSRADLVAQEGRS